MYFPFSLILDLENSVKATGQISFYTDRKNLYAVLTTDICADS